MKLSEWMNEPVDVRKAHLDLSTPCQILPRRRQWTHHLNRMLEAVGITRDVPNLIKAKIHRCHACEHDSSHPEGICGNPLHWWIGSMSENFMSKPKEQRALGGLACKGREMHWSDKIVATRRENGSYDSHPSPMKGRKHSEETKRKLREAGLRQQARGRCRRMSLSDPQMPDFED